MEIAQDHLRLAILTHIRHKNSHLERIDLHDDDEVRESLPESGRLPSSRRIHISPAILVTDSDQKHLMHQLGFHQRWFIPRDRTLGRTHVHRPASVAMKLTAAAVFRRNWRRCASFKNRTFAGGQGTRQTPVGCIRAGEDRDQVTALGLSLHEKAKTGIRLQAPISRTKLVSHHHKALLGKHVGHKSLRVTSTLRPCAS